MTTDAVSTQSFTGENALNVTSNVPGRLYLWTGLSSKDGALSSPKSHWKPVAPSEVFINSTLWAGFLTASTEGSNEAKGLGKTSKSHGNVDVTEQSAVEISNETLNKPSSS